MVIDEQDRALAPQVEALGMRCLVTDTMMTSSERKAELAADVLKAVCLGADAVLVGRPYVWGLAVGGQEGVERVLKSLWGELDVTLALLGARSIS